MSPSVAAHRLFATRPRRAALFDMAVTAATFAATLAMLSHGGILSARSGTHELEASAVLLAACSTLPLIAWRRFPLGVFAATAVASIVLAGLGYPVALIPGPVVALYLLAASRTRQVPWTWRIATLVIGLFTVRLGVTAAEYGTFPGIELLHAGLAWAGAWFAGERTRLRQEQIADLRARALRAEADTERERLLAVAEERARIARDLHDSAGHAISLIAVRAGAARLRHHQSPDRSLSALQVIEELARQTAEDIDQMVGTLRESNPAQGTVEAPAGLASLDTLIAHHAATGLQATVAVSGAQRPLGSGADQATYRILQEALTNAARHGAGSARIDLAYGDSAIEVTVTNLMRTNGSPRPGGGHGLIGMRERATLLGGSLDTVRANGTFKVHAQIPYAGHRG